MIAIIDYGAGNIASIKNAINQLGKSTVLTNDISTIQQAEKVIIPGVGNAKQAMNNLLEHNLIEVIKELKQPVLGICLGQQLMCQYSDEGDVKCIGVFDCTVKKFPKQERLPHMGWNKCTSTIGNKKLNGEFYYVHNYYCSLGKDTVATTNYSIEFSAILQKDNFFGVQFHPEKSGKIGKEFLREFILK